MPSVVCKQIHHPLPFDVVLTEVMDGHSAVDFLKRFESTACSKNWSTPALKARYFPEAFIGSPVAAFWFDKLPHDVKTDYKRVEQAFMSVGFRCLTEDELYRQFMSRQQRLCLKDSVGKACSII